MPVPSVGIAGSVSFGRPVLRPVRQGIFNVSHPVNPVSHPVIPVSYLEIPVSRSVFSVAGWLVVGGKSVLSEAEKKLSLRIEYKNG